MNRRHLALLILSLPMFARADLDAGQAAIKAKDYATAVKELTPLANNGNPVAEKGLGWLYQYGLGEPKDMQQAMAWYQKSADQGYGPAELNMGTAYAMGQGVPVDNIKALAYLQRAADHGLPAAAHNLAIMYTGVPGIPADYPKAVALYIKAIQGGYAPSVYNLGVIYANGAPGVKRDPISAYAVFSQAAANDSISLGYKGILATRLSAEDIAKADALAPQFKLGTPPS